jgi:hypothetical protein
MMSRIRPTDAIDGEIKGQVEGRVDAIRVLIKELHDHVYQIGAAHDVSDGISLVQYLRDTQREIRLRVDRALFLAGNNHKGAMDE